jgi:hypothetical protein
MRIAIEARVRDGRNHRAGQAKAGRAAARGDGFGSYRIGAGTATGAERLVNRGFGRILARAKDRMPDDDIVAIGLLTRTHLRMLGSSLKTVFHVDDGAAQFAELLEALDRIGETRGPE